MVERTPSPQQSRRPRPTRPEPPVPEWMTERWKHQVEAEARGRLKRRVHDVATHEPPRAETH